MQQNDDFPTQSTSAGSGMSQSNYQTGKSRTSLVRVQNQKLRLVDDKNDFGKFRRGNAYYCSKTDLQYQSKSREDARNETKFLRKYGRSSEEQVFSAPDFVVSECWKTGSGEIPVKLIQLFKENADNIEEDSENIPSKKRRLVPEEDNEKLSYTKEFHVLTEIQKERIVTVVEDAIKKLANKDMKEFSDRLQAPSQEIGVVGNEPIPAGSEKFLRKFLLSWVITKIIQMVLCHIIQIIFLSGESYFRRKKDFLPVVVTYYVTLFIVILSLILHISFYIYSKTRNPCYFMGVISFSVLTLTTTLGLMVMLVSMQYYNNFREIVVLVFVGILLFSLFAELCLYYLEVKSIWKSVTQTERYYVA